MDNLINSLVGNFAINAGNANMADVTDYQGKTYNRDQLLALSKQVAGSIDANAIKGGVFGTKGESVGFNYDEATKLLGHPPSAAEQVILDMSRHLLNEGVTDLNQADASTTNRRFGSTYTGGGGTIYELKKDADGKPIISSWSKDTSDKKAILTGLAIAATVFGIPGVTEGLLGGAPAGATLGSVGADAAATTAFELANAGVGAFEGGTALNTLAGTGAGSAFELANAGAGAFEGGTALNSLAAMTPAELATFEAANAGATAMTDLGASELANAGASANVVGGTTIPSAVTPLTTAAAAKTLIDPLTGLAISAAGNVLGNVANQQGITDARNAITTGSANATTALNNAYTNAQNLNAAGRTDLANNYANLNTNLNNTLNGQSGIYNATNTSLANNYANLNTNLNNTLNAQAGVYNTTGTNLANNYSALGTNLSNTLASQKAAYEAANQAINSNASTQLGLLGSTYQGQKDQAAANAAGLNANYNATLGNMGNVYNQQVGFQQPYQDVGRAGSTGLVNNQDYLTRQFSAADLMHNLRLTTHSNCNKVKWQTNVPPTWAVVAWAVML